jgi:hypothetical protein
MHPGRPAAALPPRTPLSAARLPPARPLALAAAAQAQRGGSL